MQKVLATKENSKIATIICEEFCRPSADSVPSKVNLVYTGSELSGEPHKADLAGYQDKDSYFTALETDYPEKLMEHDGAVIVASHQYRRQDATCYRPPDGVVSTLNVSPTLLNDPSFVNLLIQQLSPNHQGFVTAVELTEPRGTYTKKQIDTCFYAIEILRAHKIPVIADDLPPDLVRDFRSSNLPCFDGIKFDRNTTKMIADEGLNALSFATQKILRYCLDQGHRVIFEGATPSDVQKIVGIFGPLCEFQGWELSAPIRKNPRHALSGVTAAL